MPARIDIPPGTVFGRLTVIEEARTPGGRRAMLCRCECGTEKVVDLAKLRAGHTRSCGCLHREQAVDLARINTTNGMSKHVHRDRWANMMDRCTSPDNNHYHNYGARGIEVCPEWHDVAVFCAWIDENLGPCPPGMSMDRINNDGNYEPGNVRWATASQQVRNSTLAKLTADAAADIRTRRAAGETLKALAAEFGVSTGAIWFVAAGWTWREP